MSRMEDRIKEITARLSQWWKSMDLRRSASAGAQRAATKVKDMRDSETAKRAEAKLHDLRDSETAKRAATKVKDMRDSDAAKKAESALADLRQREPVKKAEEGARKVMHDLFSGSSSSKSDSTGEAS